MGLLLTGTSPLFSRKMMSIERLILQRATILASKVVRERACVCIVSGKRGRFGSLSQIVTLGTLETMIAARFSNHLTGTVSSPHVYLLQ